MLPNFLKPYHTALSNLIRLGRKSDGGYVIDKRVISKTRAIITCGLEAEWSFEKQFQEYNKNCKILAFDHTVNKKFWAERFLKDFIALFLLKKIKPKQIIDVFKFLQYLAFFRGKNKHYLKKIVSTKINNNNQVTITEAIGENKDIVLKIDIEGDEYKILNAINNNFDQIYLLIIEFHNIHKNINKIKNFLTKSKFKLIHIHGNNFAGVNKNKDPNVVEMTMLNSKKFKLTKSKSDLKYPIYGLDYKNFKRRDDIELNFND